MTRPLPPGEMPKSSARDPRVVGRWRAILHVERNPRGPRLFVLGQRVHEYQLGLTLLAALAAGALVHAWSISSWLSLTALGAAWLVVKDWRDLVPSLRDTGAWRLGIHARFAPLRELRHADGLPVLAGAVAFAIGVVNIVSALTPNVSWRHHVLLQLEPVRALPLFHTLAVPASVALIVTALHLRGRRRRAWQVATVLLLALGILNLLKGLDFEEAALSWAGAAFLWWGRDSFVVRHERLAWRSPLFAAAAATLLGVMLGTAGLVWLGSGERASRTQVVLDTLDLLGWTQPTVVFGDGLAWVPIAVGMIGVAAIVLAGYVFFRPLTIPRHLPDEATHGAACDLVRAHGSDTLAFFKLRRDLHYLFSGDGRAFLGYRVEGRTLLVAGDPVGPSDALAGLVSDALSFAEVRGLDVAAVGASAALLPVWRDAGLQPLYVGDEAILDTDTFSLEGRAIRKVRQSVSRVDKAGHTAHAVALAELDEPTLAELEHVSSLWLGGRAERGFSMAMDTLDGEHQDESVVVLVRDGSGALKGFLHFVPVFGRPAMSLSFMRRDREATNGLTEFLVVRAVELLRERGIEELSLNFAAFGRLLDRPSGRLDRLLARLLSLGDRYFQVESLYRFNAKFSPRWEPRYLAYQRILGLPRVGVAAMVAEGQLPRLALRR
jgi:lysyl-tRNA synthetase class 2